MARIFEVQIPIAGHVFCEVTAETEAEAIQKAFEEYDPKDAQWDALEQFNQGNVCYCPQPWQVKVIDVGDED